MSESFDRALERLLHDQSPAPELPYLTDEEQAMLRMAQVLRGSSVVQARPAFVEELRERTVTPHRISRRTAVFTSMGALAAGLVGGFAIQRFRSSPDTPPPGAVGPGHWQTVSTLADLPEGAVRSFKLDNLTGFLIHRSGDVRAVSRTCTHMGCQLDFSRPDGALICPCHGAAFDLHGRLLHGPGGGPYSQPLPPLKRIQTRVTGDAIDVWTV
jgi:nitrite reductase/ring-hydroxylating ferredoxin subunit